MKTLQSFLASTALLVSLGLAPVLLPAPAFAVDNMSSTDAPDLTSVRAKSKAQDYAAALTELRDLAEDVQQADVYYLLGFTLRKTGDFKTSHLIQSDAWRSTLFQMQIRFAWPCCTWIYKAGLPRQACTSRSRPERTSAAPWPEEPDGQSTPLCATQTDTEV